ncbi:hypothetical protein ACE1CD_22915 [Aerosakkonema sp. BLCC-F183]|uniref:hypothetical protein n=1 Tax=Aerosakkonema sp. BLCC-F183 TaxID=3342834 RepID=UPI0035BA1C52
MNCNISLLLAHHIDHLNAEGFTTSHINLLQSMGVRSISEAEAIEMGFKVWSQGKWISGSGIYFPFTDGFGQIRLDTPIKREDGSIAKYLTPCKAKAQAYLPANSQAVTEGFKDAQAGSLHGDVPTAAIAGVSHYKALPQGAGITTIFDSDGWTNPNVMVSLIRCGQWLKGKINLIPEIPGQPKAGLCEFFKAGHTKEDYQKLIKNAYTPKELLLAWVQKFATIPKKWLDVAIKRAIRLAAELLGKFEQENFLNDLKKFTKVSIQNLRVFLSETLQQLHRQQRTANAEPYYLQHRYQKYGKVCQSFGLDYNNLINESTFDDFVYRQLGAKTGNWAVMDSAFYQYQGEAQWQAVEDAQVYELACAWSEQAYKLKYSKDFGYEVDYCFKNHKDTESAFKYSRKHLYCKPPDNHHLVAFNNVTVDMRNGEEMPHSKEHYLTWHIPYNYLKNAECPAVFHSYVNQAFGEEMLPYIRAYLAGYLDPTATYSWFVHLIGPSGSGKGTFIRLLGKMFGLGGYRSSSSFAELATPEGRHQHLTGARLFALPDVKGFMQGTNAFYELVDNGAMSGRPLYQSHAYEKVWNTRFIIASVNHLQVENSADGWDRRCRLLPTKERVGAIDPSLEKQLEAAIGEIIGWALAMEPNERDAILLTPNSNSQQLIDLRYEASIYADSVKFFVDRGLRPTTELGDVDDATLHSCYAALCKEHGLQPLSAPKFIAHLKTIIPKHRLERRWSPMVKGKRRILPAHWQHISFVQNAFSNIADSQKEGQSSNQYIEPVWVCHKSKCVEGGLFEFEQFWNSDPPDSPGGGGDKGGGNPPCPLGSLGSINLVANCNGGSANGSAYLVEAQSPKSSNSNTLSRVDQVDQLDRGKTLAIETKNNLVDSETFSHDDRQSTNKDGDPPDPLSPQKLTIKPEQGVQGNWETNLNSIVQMLQAVQTVGDRDAVESEARRLGLPDNWKKLVCPLLDEETLSKLKRLKQQSVGQRAAKEYQFQIGEKVVVKSHPHLIGKVSGINDDPNDSKSDDVWFEDGTDRYTEQELENVNQSNRVVPSERQDPSTNCSTQSLETTRQTSLVGKWVKLKYSDGITAYHVVAETMVDGVRLIQIELKPGVIVHRCANHIIEVFGQSS